MLEILQFFKHELSAKCFLPLLLLCCFSFSYPPELNPPCLHQELFPSHIGLSSPTEKTQNTSPTATVLSLSKLHPSQGPTLENYHLLLCTDISGLLDILVLFKPQKSSETSQSLKYIPGVVTLLALKKNEY